MKRTRLLPDPVKVREWRDRTRQRIPAMSKRRVAERPTRQAVIRQVHARDLVCRGINAVPELVCGGPLDVHELKRGAARASTYLDVDQCILLCRTHHTWVTENPRAAQARGLAKWSWEA